MLRTMPQYPSQAKRSHLFDKTLRGMILYIRFNFDDDFEFEFLDLDDED